MNDWTRAPNCANIPLTYLIFLSFMNALDDFGRWYRMYFIYFIVDSHQMLNFQLMFICVLDLNSMLTAMKSIWWIDVHCVIIRLNLMETTTSRCKFSRLDSISIACTSMLVDRLKEFENENVNWCMKTENVNLHIHSWNGTDRNVVHLKMRSIRKVNSAWYMRLLCVSIHISDQLQQIGY